MPPSPLYTTLSTTSPPPQEDHDLNTLDAISHADHYYNNNMSIIYTPHSTYDVLCEATIHSSRRKETLSAEVSLEGMEGVSSEVTPDISEEISTEVSTERAGELSWKEETKEPPRNLNYFTNRNVEGFTLLQGVYYLIENSILNCVFVIHRNRVISWRGLCLPPHAARASYHRTDSVRSPIPRDNLSHHSIVGITTLPIPRNQSVQSHGVRSEEQLCVLPVRFEGSDPHAASANSGEGDHIRVPERRLLQRRTQTDGGFLESDLAIVVQNHHFPEFLPLFHTLECQYSTYFPPTPPI